MPPWPGNSENNVTAAPAPQPSSSMVGRLLTDIADPNASVSVILRTAKIMATRLGQADALTWIERELKGYTEVVDDDFPKYRQLHGSLQSLNAYHGWQIVRFPNPEQEHRYTFCPIGVSIGVLEQQLSEGCSGAEFNFIITPEYRARVASLIRQQTELKLALDTGQLHSIVDAVRNLLLDWALGLEQAGVIGSDMTFSPHERREAAGVTHQVFNISNVGVLGDVGGRARVNNQLSTGIDHASVLALLQQARAHLGSLPDDQRHQAEPVLMEIETEVIRAQPDSSALLRNLLSLRAICEGAVGNLAASGIVALIGSIIGA